MSATERRLRKWASLSASQLKNERPTSRQRLSSGAPPSQWNQGTIPLAVVCAIHSVASAGDFVTWRQVGRLLLYEPVTLGIGRPFIPDCATRPSLAQSPITVSPEGPCCMAFNH